MSVAPANTTTRQSRYLLTYPSFRNVAQRPRYTGARTTIDDIPATYEEWFSTHVNFRKPKSLIVDWCYEAVKRVIPIRTKAVQRGFRNAKSQP
jgi:Tfp pilus assembly protein PilE